MTHHILAISLKGTVVGSFAIQRQDLLGLPFSLPDVDLITRFRSNYSNLFPIGNIELRMRICYAC